MRKTAYIISCVFIAIISINATAQVRDDVKARMEKDERFYWVPEGPNVTELEYAGEFIHPDETVRPGNAGITRLAGDSVYVHDIESGYILKYGLDGRYLGRINCEPVKSTFGIDLAIDAQERFIFVGYNEGPVIAYFFDGKKLITKQKREFDLASVAIISDDVFAMTRNHTDARKFLVSRYDFSGSHQGWLGKNEKLFPYTWMNSNRIAAHGKQLVIASAHLPDLTFLNVETGEQKTVTLAIEQLLNRARENAKRHNTLVQKKQILGMYWDSFFGFAQWLDNRLYLGTASISRTEEIICWVIISLSSDMSNVHYYRFIFSKDNLKAKYWWHASIIKRDGEIQIVTPMYFGEGKRNVKCFLGLLSPVKEELN